MDYSKIIIDAFFYIKLFTPLIKYLIESYNELSEMKDEYYYEEQNVNLWG